MQWRLKRKQNKTSYLRYRKGDIYEEEKTRRKELHEGESFVPKEVIDKANETSPTPVPQTVYQTEDEATNEKLEKIVSFNGNIWMRLATFLLSLLLIVYGVGFIAQYAISVVNEPAPVEEVEETKETVAVESDSGKWKETWDSFWTGVLPEKSDKSANEATADEAEPILRYTEEAEVQMETASEIHASILQQYAVISYDATRYSNRLINSISFNGNLLSTQSNIFMLQQQLNQSVGEEHPLYDNLNARLNALLVLVESLPDSKRSQVVPLTNTAIDSENLSGETFLQSFTNLLDQYGVPYTNENGTLTF